MVFSVQNLKLNQTLKPSGKQVLIQSGEAPFMKKVLTVALKLTKIVPVLLLISKFL